MPTEKQQQQHHHQPRYELYEPTGPQSLESKLRDQWECEQMRNTIAKTEQEANREANRDSFLLVAMTVCCLAVAATCVVLIFS